MNLFKNLIKERIIREIIIVFREYFWESDAFIFTFKLFHWSVLLEMMLGIDGFIF